MLLHDNATDCPENTMGAFNNVVEHGYGIEMDVQLTKDKIPVAVLRRFYKCRMAAWTIKSQQEPEKHKKVFDVFIFDSFSPDTTL